MKQFTIKDVKPSPSTIRARRKYFKPLFKFIRPKGKGCDSE